MKCLIFIKEFFHKKSTKNYCLIIFSLIFIVSSLLTCYEYGAKILNDNYNKSYFIVSLKNKNQYNFLSKNDNVKLLKRCVILGNKIIVENDIISNIDDHIMMVTTDEFNNYEFKNEYYMILNKWSLYNEMVDCLIKNDIEYQIILNKQTDIKIENYYNYFFYIIILIVVVSFIIYMITIINIIIDEQKNNYLYECLGFNIKKILLILIFKIIFLVLTIELLNGFIQILLKSILKISHYYDAVISISLIIITLLLIMFMIIGRRGFKFMRKKLFLALIVMISITVTTVFAAATASGTFSLQFGRYERSSYAKLEASYPYVKYTAQNSGNSTLKATLSKKAYLGLGFENVEVATTDISGFNVSYIYYGKQTRNKDYLITTVNIKENSVANASYVLTSKSTAGSV